MFYKQLLLLHALFILDYPHPPIIEVAETFSNDNVKINMEWTPEVGVSYDVVIAPSTLVNFSTSTSAQMVLSYNVNYSVSVVPVCAVRDVESNLQLMYGESKSSNVKVT